MHNDKQDKNLLEWVHRGLSHQADGLDPAVSARLRQARIQALESRAASPWQRIRQCWTNAWVANPNPLWQGFAVAAVTTVVVSLWVTQGVQDEIQRKTPHWVLDSSVKGNESVVSPMDVLMSNEDMDFLENLELYEWLAAEYG